MVSIIAGLLVGAAIGYIIAATLNMGTVTDLRQDVARLEAYIADHSEAA